MYQTPTIFISILTQELPFLVLRLITAFDFKGQSYTTVFVCKNLLILFLQISRLWSICMEHINQITIMILMIHRLLYHRGEHLYLEKSSNTQLIEHDIARILMA